MIRAKDIIYATGGTSASPGEMITFSRPGILAGTIAWAAENKIPFDQALMTMTDTGRAPKHNDILIYVKDFFWKKWSASLDLAITDIQKGSQLGQALRKRLYRFLPEYFIAAVEKAEKDGILAETMPHFAKRINFITEIKANLLTALLFVLMETLIICLVTIFQSIFIIPRLSQIICALCEGDDSFLQFVILPVSGIHNIFFHHLLFWIVAVMLLIPLAARFGHIARVYVEEIFLRIPVLGKYMRKIIVLELAASMSSCLATGHGIVEAADFSLASTRRPWLKAKLRDFRKSVCDGQDWADAWMEMKLGIPIADWMVRNSARREKPVEGFDTLLKWLCHDVAITSVRHVQWIEVAGIFFNGILVTMFALALFGSLILIINHLATVW